MHRKQDPRTWCLKSRKLRKPIWCVIREGCCPDVEPDFTDPAPWLFGSEEAAIEWCRDDASDCAEKHISLLTVEEYMKAHGEYTVGLGDGYSITYYLYECGSILKKGG